MINTHLELTDISSLRSVCRNLSAKASNGIFKTACSKGRMRLTERGISAFESIARVDVFGPRIKHLTIAGIIHSSRIAILTSEDSLKETLPNIFRALKSASKTGGLEGITLEVAISHNNKLFAPIIQASSPTRIMQVEPGVPSASLQQVRETAQKTFETVIRALRISQLPTKSLRVFTDQIGCAVPVDTFASVFSGEEEEEDHAFGHHLRQLSIRLCQSLSSETDEDSTLMANEESLYTRKFGRFTRLFPNLELLDLRIFRHHYRSSISLEPQLFLHTSHENVWPALRSFTLRGMTVRCTALENFIDSHIQTLKHVALVDMSVSSGEVFRSVFKVFFQHGSALASLHLQNLREREPVCFEEEFGETSLLERSGPDARKQIRYSLGYLPPRLEARSTEYLKEKLREDGPLA